MRCSVRSPRVGASWSISSPLLFSSSSAMSSGSALSMRFSSCGSSLIPVNSVSLACPTMPLTRGTVRLAGFRIAHVVRPGSSRSEYRPVRPRYTRWYNTPPPPFCAPVYLPPAYVLGVRCPRRSRFSISPPYSPAAVAARPVRLRRRRRWSLRVLQTSSPRYSKAGEQRLSSASNSACNVSNSLARRFASRWPSTNLRVSAISGSPPGGG